MAVDNHGSRNERRSLQQSLALVFKRHVLEVVLVFLLLLEEVALVELHVDIGVSKLEGDHGLFSALEPVALLTLLTSPKLLRHILNDPVRQSEMDSSSVEINGVLDVFFDRVAVDRKALELDGN